MTSGSGDAAPEESSILAAVLGIHEMVVLIMVLVAGIGYLIERFAPAPADSEAGDKKNSTPE